MTPVRGPGRQKILPLAAQGRQTGLHEHSDLAGVRRLHLIQQGRESGGVDACGRSRHRPPPAEARIEQGQHSPVTQPQSPALEQNLPVGMRGLPGANKLAHEP